MKQLSIGTKLLWITSALFLITVAILSISLWWSLSDQNQRLSAEVQQTMELEIRDKLEASAAQYGEKVAGFIDEAYRIPWSLAGILELTSERDPMTREEVQTTVEAVLRKNSQVSSIYAQFEPDGYDGQDWQYQQQASKHSVPGAGSLEIYFTRNNDGSIEQHQVDDAEEKYVATLNEFGIREAEWYLCGKDTLKPCLMEPYLYEIAPGNNELMTSLTVPALREGQFAGIVGVDVNLPVFQKLIDQLSQSLYQGKAKVTLLSSKGLVVAASHYSKKARPLAESVAPELAAKMVALAGGEGFMLTDNDIVVAHRIDIPLSGSRWSLLIEVPKVDAFAPVAKLSEEMTVMATELGSLLLGVGVLVSVLAVLAIALVIRSILAPLKSIQSRVENLASAEGDLTQSIQVTSHAELIALGAGVNAFILKLRELISELKMLAGRSRDEGQTTAEIARQTLDSVNRQYSEIESVVAAVNQMSATAHEVAKASEQTASETESMAVNVRDSETSLNKAMDYVNTMSSESMQAKAAVAKVAESSNNISSILEVISAIAEQTNLLALNAAIEAARAGDQGRGFAVVADEVRALASKTQSSTLDIGRLIESLQQEVGSASNIIERGVEQAKNAVSQTEQALSALNLMVSQLDQISAQITHIATAAEEQSAVTEEVNKNITGISDSAAELARLAGEAEQSSQTLAQLVDSQNDQLDRLKT